jgi:hypothetical protein
MHTKYYLFLLEFWSALDCMGRGEICQVQFWGGGIIVVVPKSASTKIVPYESLNLDRISGINCNYQRFYSKLTVR